MIEPVFDAVDGLGGEILNADEATIFGDHKPRGEVFKGMGDGEAGGGVGFEIGKDEAVVVNDAVEISDAEVVYEMIDLKARGGTRWSWRPLGWSLVVEDGIGIAVVWTIPEGFAVVDVTGDIALGP